MRNIRPSWVRISSDTSSNNPEERYGHGHGPKGRTGTLSASFLARIEGEAVPFLEVTAIGSADGVTTVWQIVDKRTGALVFSETVRQ